MSEQQGAVSMAIWKAAPHLIDQADAERMADAAIAAIHPAEPTEVETAVTCVVCGGKRVSVVDPACFCAHCDGTGIEPFASEDVIAAIRDLMDAASTHGAAMATHAGPDSSPDIHKTYQAMAAKYDAVLALLGLKEGQAWVR